jgi:predicted Zn-dependent protease with MMP-like domain
MKLNSRQFDQIVQQALDRIPARFRETMDNLLITVEQRPSRELLEEMDLPPDEPLFGVFEGVPLPERSIVEPPLYPDRIILFQQPLQQVCRSLEELESEIEITVVHELAHYLGMDEAELQDLGYG